RVVRTPAGEIKVDVTGKLSGRGAYVCPTPQCAEAGVREGRLQHALLAPIPEDVGADLERAIETVRTAQSRNDQPKIIRIPAGTPVDTPALGAAPAKPAAAEPPVKAKPAPTEIKVVPRPVAPPAEHIHPASPPKVTSRDAKPAMRPAAAAPGTMAPPRPPVKPGPPRREAPPRPMPPRAPVEAPPPSAAPAPAVTPPRERIPKIKERIPPPPPPEPVAPPPVVPAEIEVAGPITVGELA